MEIYELGLLEEKEDGWSLTTTNGTIDLPDDFEIRSEDGRRWYGHKGIGIRDIIVKQGFPLDLKSSEFTRLSDGLYLHETRQEKTLWRVIGKFCITVKAND